MGSVIEIRLVKCDSTKHLSYQSSNMGEMSGECIIAQVFSRQTGVGVIFVNK